ncbi:dTDP-4-dehydrorhamnose 3,5-epimerase family protein, partial [Bacillus sp. D-CC]
VPHTIVMYKVDEYYSANHDSGVLWNDKDLAIPWPVTSPILSDKDRILPSLQDCEDSF